MQVVLKALPNFEGRSLKYKAGKALRISVLWCSWLHSWAVANIGVCMSIIFFFLTSSFATIVGKKADNPIICVILKL